MSSEKTERPKGMCAEIGCSNKATRKYKTRDGFKISLCKEHYRKWESRGEHKKEEKPETKSRRLAKIRNFFHRRKEVEGA